MARLLEGEDGAMMIMQRQLHGNHSNQRSVAAHIAAWRLEDGGPISPSARSRYIHWCLSSGAMVDAFLHAQAFASPRSITAALQSSNTSNTRDEVRIPVQDHGFENRIADSPVHTHINISQSPYYASSSPERGREVVEPLLNRSRLTEAFLVIGAQVALTLSTFGSKTATSGSSSLSRNADLLLEFAMACNVVGFLFCLYGILLCGHKTGVAARIVTGIGYAATVFGVLAVMCIQLLERLMFWFTAVTCIVSLPALAAAFAKRTDYPRLFFR